MELLERVSCIVRANTRWFYQQVSPSSSPDGSLLETQMEQLQTALVQVRLLAAQAIAILQRTQRQFAQSRVQSETWLRRARLAVAGGNETLARQALAHHLPYAQQVQFLRGSLEQQQGLAEQLQQVLLILGRYLQAAKINSPEAIAGASTLFLEAGEQDLCANGELLIPLEQLIDWVEQTASQLSAAQVESPDYSKDALNQRFRQLEQAHEIEQLLQAIRREAQLNPKTEVKLS
jgi:phage shock protein A